VNTVPPDDDASPESSLPHASRAVRIATVALRWVLLAVLVGAALWYAHTHRDVLDALANVSAWHLALILALCLLMKLWMALAFKCICGIFDLKMRFREWFGLSVCTTMLNQMMPGRAGAAMRAVYLKQKHRLPFAHFGSLVAGTHLIRLPVTALIALAACGIGRLAGGAGWGPLAVTFLVLLALLAIATVLATASARLIRYVPFRAVRAVLERLARGLRLFPERKGQSAQIALWSALEVCTLGAVLLVSCRAVGMDVSAPQALAMRSLGVFAILLPLTPAGLGIREGMVSYAGHLLGLPVQTLVLAALIARAAAILVSFALGLPFSYVLLGRAIPTVETPEAGPPQGGA
jgi:uncharacterized protein (TIRG00374 family)